MLLMIPLLLQCCSVFGLFACYEDVSPLFNTRRVENFYLFAEHVSEHSPSTKYIRKTTTTRAATLFNLLGVVLTAYHLFLNKVYWWFALWENLGRIPIVTSYTQQGHN